jgi:glycosyltransferase involved in cell wall biosynthesis
LERSLAERCDVSLLPPYYYGSSVRMAVAMAEEFLAEVDALLLSVTPHPVHLEALAQVRRLLGVRVPFLYLPLGEFPRGALSYRQLYRYLEPEDTVLCSCTADLAVYESLVRSSPARVTVVPFGIDPRPFSAARQLRPTTRRQLGLAEDDIVVVAHGRNEPEKNVHGAVAAFAQLWQRIPSCRMWILGTVAGRGPGVPGPVPLPALTADPYRDLLVDSLGEAPDDVVCCWGDVPPPLLPEVLAASDIGINLSVNPDENFGFSAVESMAAGLPMIGTDWGGLRDTIEHEHTGYLLDTTSTAHGVAVDLWAAVDHLTALATDPALRSRLGQAGAERVARHFRLDRFADDVVDLAESAAAGSAERRQHEWTALGRQLVERYSVPLSGSRSGSFPVPQPAEPTAADLELMRRVAEPYATRRQDEEIDERARYALATGLMRLQPGRLGCFDPLHDGLGREVSEAESEALRLLLARPVCCSRLRSMVGPGVLRQWLQAGLVVRTTAGD